MYTLDYDQDWDFKIGAGESIGETFPLTGTKIIEQHNIYAGVSATITGAVETSRTSSTHYQYSFEFTSTFSTSQSPDDAGHASDIIIGGGVDLIVLEGTKGKYFYFILILLKFSC